MRTKAVTMNLRGDMKNLKSLTFNSFIRSYIIWLNMYQTLTFLSCDCSQLLAHSKKSQCVSLLHSFLCKKKKGYLVSDADWTLFSVKKRGGVFGIRCWLVKISWVDVFCLIKWWRLLTNCFLWFSIYLSYTLQLGVGFWKFSWF